ncbi:hypothetical protein EC880221_1822, partial [Escherichia coli 88.0221]
TARASYSRLVVMTTFCGYS